MKRLHYLDNLRILLSILVVLHHVGIGYGTMGGWCYISKDTMQGFLPMVLSALFGIEANFSMSLFFFISAYLTPYSLDKKGAGRFIKNQLLRLGIPLLFVMIIFAPTVLYFIEVYRNSTELSWLQYVWLQNIYSPNTSHAWFILVLIVFEIIYVLYWKFLRPKFSISANIKNSLPSHWQIAAFIIILSVLVVLVRQIFPIGTNIIGLQFGNFVPHIALYAFGILVSRKGWLDQLLDKVVLTWFYISLPVTLLFGYLFYLVLKNPPFITNFIVGFHWESLSLAFMQTIICIGFCGFLFYIFRKGMNYTNSLLTVMTQNRYGVYIIHSAIVVGITIIFEYIQMQAYLKFLFASILSVLFSFLFVGLIRKIKIVERVI